MVPLLVEPDDRKLSSENAGRVGVSRGGDGRERGRADSRSGFPVRIPDGISENAG